MGPGSKAREELLEICLDWCIRSTNANGQSGGLAVLWNLRVASLRSYKDRESFWNPLMHSGFLWGQSLILAGDLNFTISANEV